VTKHILYINAATANQILLFTKHAIYVYLIRKLRRPTVLCLVHPFPGEKLGYTEVHSLTSDIKHDMAVDGKRLYLASNNGLSTSREGSSVCVIS